MQGYPHFFATLVYYGWLYAAVTPYCSSTIKKTNGIIIITYVRSFYIISSILGDKYMISSTLLTGTCGYGLLKAM